MRLGSQGSQFVFNLPSDFLPQEIINTYTPIMEKNWIQYENVIDYLNSTITSVNFPGITFDTPKQIRMRGKVRDFLPAKNVYDILTTRELQVTLRSVDADLNYWIMFDVIMKHYLDTENAWVKPFIISCLDIHRDVIYQIKFEEIIAKTLSDNIFNYSQMRITQKTFTVTFNFNFYNIEYMLNKSKILSIENLPTIIQKI